MRKVISISATPKIPIAIKYRIIKDCAQATTCLKRDFSQCSFQLRIGKHVNSAKGRTISLTKTLHLCCICPNSHATGLD